MMEMYTCLIFCMQLKAVCVVRIANAGQSAPETAVARVCALDVSWLHVVIMCVLDVDCLHGGCVGVYGCGCRCAFC